VTNTSDHSLLAAKIASLIGEKLDEFGSAVSPPKAAAVTFEPGRNLVQKIDVVCGFQLPGGTAVPVRRPIDLGDTGPDGLAHLAADLAEQIDTLASYGHIEEDYAFLRPRAEQTYATAKAEGLPVRLLAVRVETSDGGGHEIVADVEQMNVDLQWWRDSFPVASEEDLAEHLSALRETLPGLKRLRDRMMALGGDLLFDDVAVRQVRLMGIDIGNAVAGYLDHADAQRHPTLSAADGSRLMLYPRNGVIQCEGRLSDGATWIAGSLRLRGAVMPAEGPEALTGRRIGDIFDHPAIDPDLKVRSAESDGSSVRLMLSPKVWSVSRSGGVVDFDQSK